MMGSNSKRLIENKYFKDGNYELSLPPNRNYWVEVKRDGAKINAIEISTHGEKYINQNISIGEIAISSPVKTEVITSTTIEEPKINTSPSELVSTYAETTTYTEPENNSSPITTSSEPIETSLNTPTRVYDGSTYVARGASKRDNLEYSTRAPRHGGVYYKIQIIADKTFSPSEPKFIKVNHLGRFDTEYLSERGIYRVLLADYFSLDNAKEILQTVKENGFKRAFIVKYIDGERLGMFYR